MSNKNILPKSFYTRDTLVVAEELLGCFLVRKCGRKVLRARITEVEAYVGEDDLACHASKGRTKRTEIMYGEAGRAYVYLIYGMYDLLNVVTEKEGFPAAVLIRGVTVEGEPMRSTNGPGKLTRFLGIDRSFNGKDLSEAKELWIERGEKEKGERVRMSKRIGVDYAKHCKDYLWRFELVTE